MPDPVGQTAMWPEPTASIKALPLWQPWASLVIVGAKRVETRAYPPQRIGLSPGQIIAIHACKTERELGLCRVWPFNEHLIHLEGVATGLPLGALLGTCVIDRATQITEEAADELERSDPQEYAFGNYEPGRWAWVLRDVVELPEPVPFTGSQGTFDVPMDLLAVTA